MKHPIIAAQRRRHHKQHRTASSLFLIIFVMLFLETMLLSRLKKDDYRGLEQTLQSASSGFSDSSVIPRPNEIEDDSPSIALDSSGSFSVTNNNKLMLKCQNHSVWRKDHMWRNGILQPEICRASNGLSTSTDDNDKTFQQEQLALLVDTIHGSNADFIPCGVHCIYHLDSAYSYQHGHPIFGWLLRVDKTKTTKARVLGPVS
jgi:hypothetical protein